MHLSEKKISLQDIKISLVNKPLAIITGDFNYFKASPDLHAPTGAALVELIKIAKEKPDEFDRYDLVEVRKLFGHLPTVQQILVYIEKDPELAFTALGSEHDAVRMAAIDRFTQEGLTEDKDQKIIYMAIMIGGYWTKTLEWLAQNTLHSKTCFSLLELDDTRINQILAARLNQFKWTQLEIDQMRAYHPKNDIRKAASELKPTIVKKNLMDLILNFGRNRRNP